MSVLSVIKVAMYPHPESSSQGWAVYMKPLDSVCMQVVYKAIVLCFNTVVSASVCLQVSVHWENKVQHHNDSSGRRGMGRHEYP